MASTTILEKIGTEENLLHAWGKMDKTNKSSHGLSGESIEKFQDNLQDKIASISKKLIAGKYSFSKNRAVLIPKANGKFRPLQVPEISDRLVLKAIAIELEEQLKHVIKKSEGISFAYQKKLGIKDAFTKIVSLYKDGFKYALEADLINFFGEVSKDDLIQNQIFPKLKDNSLNGLISSALNQEIGGLEKFNPEQKSYFENLNNGIPQGNPLSPLLSNIYLSPFDLFMKAQGFQVVRYADDFVVMCKSKDDCKKAYEACLEILNNLKLKIHELSNEGKTRILEIDNDTLTFLSITFNGKIFYPSIENFDRLKNKIRDVCNGSVEYNVLSLLKKLNNIFDGWISAFYYTEIEVYNLEIDHFINRQLLLALRRFDWKFTPSSLGKLPRKFRHDGESSDCLSETQRKFSGIGLCMDIVKEKRKQNAA
jgi:RNA-directed DNA polymerase